MCGDGANDCGALKAADAGVSLSETEASIAAPFASKVQDISCILTVLREGRACLSMTIQAFKFIVLYALIESISVCILYRKGVNLSDNQYLYIDMVVLFPLSIFSSWTAASFTLTKDLPSHSLMKVPILISIIG
jgi:cation-transporting ATPase 13A2